MHESLTRLSVLHLDAIVMVTLGITAKTVQICGFQIVTVDAYVPDLAERTQIEFQMSNVAKLSCQLRKKMLLLCKASTFFF